MRERRRRWKRCPPSLPLPPRPFPSQGGHDGWIGVGEEAELEVIVLSNREPKVDRLDGEREKTTKTKSRSIRGGE